MSYVPVQETGTQAMTEVSTKQLLLGAMYRDLGTEP